MSTGNVGVRNWFGRFRATVGGHYGALLPHQKAYVNAALFFVIYLVLSPFGWEFTQGFAILAMLSWGMALTSDLSAFYSRISESPLGKLLLVVVVGVGANVAIAISAQLVNELVGVDPGKFAHTIAFASVLVSVVLILLSLSAIFILGLGFGVMYLMFHWSDGRFISMIFPWYRVEESTPYKRSTITVQVVSFLVLCGLAFSWVTDGKHGYNAFVEDKARWFLYTFEMYKKSPCVMRDGQRVAFLSDDQVLVASEEGDVITFQVQPCLARE